MKTIRWWQRLSVQITVPLLCAMLLVIAGLAYFMISAQQQAALRTAKLELGSSIVVVQGAFNRMYTSDRKIAIPELLSEIHVHPNVMNAALVDRFGGIVAAYEPNVLSGELSGFLAELDKDYLTEVANSTKTIVKYHPEHAHVIAVAPIIESTSIHQRAQRNLLVVEYRHEPNWYRFEPVPWQQLSLLLLLFLAVFYVLWWALRRWVARPADQLAHAVMEFGSHGQVTSTVLPTQLPNEFGVLARNIELALQERRAREATLRKLSAAVEQASESIMITDLKGEVEYVNPAFEKNTGYSAHEVVGKNPRFLASGRTPRQNYQALWQRLSEGETWQGELYNLRKDGVEFREWATISPLRDEQGMVTHYLASKLNITQRVEDEARIEHLAYYDKLTELPNRLSCNDYLTRMLQRLDEQTFAAVVLFDLDGIQRINDVRGFEFGDVILTTVAERIRTLGTIHRQGFVANLGGDLFAVVLDAEQQDAQVVLEDARAFAKQVLLAINETIVVRDEYVSISASAGIVICSGQVDSADAIIRHAETAVHTAKDAGGNQTAVYDASYSLELEKRYDIERELRRALTEGGLQLYLQPQVDRQQRLFGAEVLVRWQHHERGMISPADFIPVAEQTDLIVDLGKWIMQHAFEALAQLPEPLVLAINISPRQFRKYDFVSCVERLLADSGVDPHRLIFEVTENLLVEDVNDVVRKMLALQKLGIQFSIDDFGTGYSSLSYLRKLPLQEIKIDKSFVQAVDDDEQRAIVDSIFAIARHLNLRLVAEGVETQAQLDYLVKADPAVVLQGFYIAKPMPIDAFLARYFGAEKPLQ